MSHRVTFLRYPFALDHFTVTDTTPSQLVEVAHAVGCRAVCIMMEPLAVLPRMPQFNIHGDTPERRATSDEGAHE